MSEHHAENLRRSVQAVWRIFVTTSYRLLAAFALVPFFTAFGLFFTIWFAGQSKDHPVDVRLLLYVAGFTGLGIISFQTFLNCRKSKYDVSLAITYVKILFEDSRTIRFIASEKVLLVLAEPDTKRKLELSHNVEIEPVLDILEDIGCLVHGGNMSDEVAFHYFSHWVVLYLEPLEVYLLSLKRLGKTKYCNLLPLLDRMRLVEISKTQRGVLKYFCIGDSRVDEIELKKGFGRRARRLQAEFVTRLAVFSTKHAAASE
jgi:hypothetical protein